MLSREIECPTEKGDFTASDQLYTIDDLTVEGPNILGLKRAWDAPASGTLRGLAKRQVQSWATGPRTTPIGGRMQTVPCRRAPESAESHWTPTVGPVD